MALKICTQYFYLFLLFLGANSNRCDEWMSSFLASVRRVKNGMFFKPKRTMADSIQELTMASRNVTQQNFKSLLAKNVGIIFHQNKHHSPTLRIYPIYLIIMTKIVWPQFLEVRKPCSLFKKHNNKNRTGKVLTRTQKKSVHSLYSIPFPIVIFQTNCNQSHQSN